MKDSVPSAALLRRCRTCWPCVADLAAARPPRWTMPSPNCSATGR